MKHFITKRNVIVFFFTAFLIFALIFVLLHDSALEKPDMPQKSAEQILATPSPGSSAQAYDAPTEHASDRPKPAVDQAILDKFKNTDKIVLGCYYDILDGQPEPEKTVITNKSIIDEFIRLMSIKSNREFSPEGRQTAQTITIYCDGKKTAVKLVYDDLYNQGAFFIDKQKYSAHYGLFRFAAQLYGVTPERIAPKDAKKLFAEYGWTATYISETKNIALPKSLVYKEGDAPDAYYWKVNLELSKKIGLDFSGALGQKVQTERYYLSEPLPESFRPYIDSFALILRKDDKIIGAFIESPMDYGCALDGSTVNYKQIIKTDTTSKEHKALEKLSPKEVMLAYYAALNARDDEEIQKYLSVNILINSTEDSSEYPESNTPEYKIKKIEPGIDLDDPNTTHLDITFEYKSNGADSSWDEGLNYTGVRLVKENNCWKFDGIAN